MNFQLWYDKIFRRTIFLRPLPDKTFEAVDITGFKEQFLKDKIGATAIEPACIINVRGLKRVDKIAIKFHGSPIMANMFDGNSAKVRVPDIPLKTKDAMVKCDCGKEITVPAQDLLVQVPEVEIAVPRDQNMTEKTFGDMLNYAEIAGRMQAEHSPDADKKMNMILLAAVAAVGIGVIIYFKMNSGGG